MDRPCLILLDLNMPVMGGIEFLRVVKNDGLHLKRIPVVVLTTSEEQEDKLESFNLGVAGYIRKPLDYQRYRRDHAHHQRLLDGERAARVNVAMTRIPVRVMLVEDDQVDRLACRRTLANHPDYAFELIEAGTGREGVQLALALQPDLILLDYHLPDLSGLEFLAELQREGGDMPVPVMMLTRSDNVGVAVEAMRRGARDYLVKDRERGYLTLLPAVIERGAEDIDAVRRIDRSGQPAFAEEPLARLGRIQFMAQDFERDPASAFQIIRLERGAHPALPQQPDDAVMAELLARLG